MAGRMDRQTNRKTDIKMKKRYQLYICLLVQATYYRLRTYLFLKSKTNLKQKKIKVKFYQFLKNTYVMAFSVCTAAITQFLVIGTRHSITLCLYSALFSSACLCLIGSFFFSSIWSNRTQDITLHSTF